MITVGALIELLQNRPPDQRVIIRGYEGGYNDIEGVSELPLRLNVNTAWYYGKHEEPGLTHRADTTATLIS